MKIFVFLSMIFLHVLNDFGLQGILAEMKCKSFWEDKGSFYKQDWITALIMHAFSWTFMIMLPIAIYKYSLQISFEFCAIFIANLIIHAFIDHLKANCKYINLVGDQFIHVMQMLGTFAILLI